jgi:hypothetical protein
VLVVFRGVVDRLEQRHGELPGFLVAGRAVELRERVEDERLAVEVLARLQYVA